MKLNGNIKKNFSFLYLILIFLAEFIDPSDDEIIDLDLVLLYYIFIITNLKFFYYY